MTTTIQQAVRPLFITCFIIGLGVYPLKESRPKCIIYLSFLYSLTAWFIFWYFLYYLISPHSLISLYRTYNMIIVTGINIIVVIMSVILNICYDKRFQIFMKKLAAVDNTLEELGTSKIYLKIHMLSKKVIIAWITCSLILNFYDTLWWLNKGETSFWIYILPHLINHFIHINIFMDSIFIIFLWYINNRFDKINEHMKYLLVKEQHGLRNKWKKPVITVYRYTDNYERVLWSLMQLHLELCCIARELNEMFGMQMVLEMASYLFYVTSLCHYAYGMLLQKVQEEASITAWFGNFLWSFIFILRLCAINYFCETVSVKANKTSKIIDQLTGNLRYAKIRKELYQFTLQIMHRPLKFTGMGLFYFGNNFVQKFCMRFVTFIIIILQMSGN
ncbi:uncharacterized protein [Anoplolepis gracilipes]|uniref:uncharacterized protein n=1 Tax=Anoplolepis gracilipes TaxID=354296 RepID=UPI003BA33FF3